MRGSTERGPPHGTDPHLARLIAGCAVGDHHAMAALFDQTAEFVLRMCWLVVRDNDQAERCAGAAYRRVWSEAIHYEVGAVSPRCWLATIAYLSAREM